MANFEESTGKHHLSRDGVARPCEADVCPLGENTPHSVFYDQKAAQAWAEELNAQDAGGNFNSKKLTKQRAKEDVVLSRDPSQGIYKITALNKRLQRRKAGIRSKRTHLAEENRILAKRNRSMKARNEVVLEMQETMDTLMRMDFDNPRDTVHPAIAGIAKIPAGRGLLESLIIDKQDLKLTLLDNDLKDRADYMNIEYSGNEEGANAMKRDLAEEFTPLVKKMIGDRWIGKGEMSVDDVENLMEWDYDRITFNLDRGVQSFDT